MSSDKNELLFQEFEINYNNLAAVHRKGTILLRVKVSIRFGCSGNWVNSESSCCT